MQSSMLFSPISLNGLSLKNRITMAPMFVGYANEDGAVSTLSVEHYRHMAASGAAMIVVENAAVHPSGFGAPRTLAVYDDYYLPGLAGLADAIHKEGALAFIQLNHAGRFAYVPDRIAPSPVETANIMPIEMSQGAIASMLELFASGARRAKEAGFDGVEIDGGSGHLLVQFLSKLTNLRTDAYGGPIENRMRFPLEVVDAVLDAVGNDYPVGYRFLADECLPDGLGPEETARLASELRKRRLAYLSVTVGTYDSFYLPEFIEREKEEGYMTPYAAAVKGAAPDIAVIASGRIQTPRLANSILEEGAADLIGLARTLFADPRWPQKAAGILQDEIIDCDRSCSLCTKRAMAGLPAFCDRWDKVHRKEFLERVKRIEGEANEP